MTFEDAGVAIGGSGGQFPTCGYHFIQTLTIQSTRCQARSSHCLPGLTICGEWLWPAVSSRHDLVITISPGEVMWSSILMWLASQTAPRGGARRAMPPPQRPDKNDKKNGPICSILNNLKKISQWACPQTPLIRWFTSYFWRSVSLAPSSANVWSRLWLA